MFRRPNGFLLRKRGYALRTPTPYTPERVPIKPRSPEVCGKAHHVLATLDQVSSGQAGRVALGQQIARNVDDLRNGFNIVQGLANGVT